MKNERMPTYTEACKTIKRSIQARGGISEEKRVIEALVWNYYKHLPFMERKKIGLIHPRSWNASQWIEFRRKLSTEESLTSLVNQARDHLYYAINIDRLFRIVIIFDECNNQKKMLVMPDTKITIGS